jgi:two-component system phosphate regulon response regulator PhoB
MAQRVVVVDDEEDYRLILKDILEEAGFEVRLAADGLAGLSLTLEYKPEIILVDWVMPEMKGPQFVESLRGHEGFNNIPVIMLTVNQTEENKLVAIKAGVDDFIVKPFQSDDLMRRIRAVMELRSKT